MKKLEATEMWLLGKLVRMSRTEKVTDNEMLRRVRADREFNNIMKIRESSYLRHISWREIRDPITLIESRIHGKRSRGCKRLAWIDNNLNVEPLQPLFLVFHSLENL